ncbi:hypothetical protein ECO103_5075 [Escherichia coli O103:H2 str. 12009]|nr:hypothetical protein ECO103_5075 [Escherichia coli O103:H2 str. 12009]
MFKPRAFGNVFRMVLQHATAVAGITIVRGGLRSTGTGAPVESDIGFGVHSIVPYRQTTRRGRRPGASSVVGCEWQVNLVISEEG